MQAYFRVVPQSHSSSLGLLALRLVSGAALVLHAVPKIQDPTGWLPRGPFPDWALAIGAFGEFVGGLLLVLGLATPAAAILVLGVMVGAVWYHFGKGDAFVDPGSPSYELALMHAAAALVFLLVGPGSLSADAMVFGRKGT
jgi:putative oxidoreductase